uniref:Uncharacterized protein n=1 Tax=Trichuris muris TaxID=70415 RepID=A0A5S6QF72_TRIMR
MLACCRLPNRLILSELTEDDKPRLSEEMLEEKSPIGPGSASSGKPPSPYDYIIRFCLHHVSADYEHFPIIERNVSGCTRLKFCHRYLEARKALSQIIQGIFRVYPLLPTVGQSVATPFTTQKVIADVSERLSLLVTVLKQSRR